MTEIEWTDETWNPVSGCSKARLHPDRLGKPLRWRKPRRVFVSDLFHEDVPDEFIDKVMAIVALTPQHTYQVLTKRPERMRDYMASRQGQPILDFSEPEYEMPDGGPVYFCMLRNLCLDEA